MLSNTPGPLRLPESPARLQGRDPRSQHTVADSPGRSPRGHRGALSWTAGQPPGLSGLPTVEHSASHGDQGVPSPWTLGSLRPQQVQAGCSGSHSSDEEQPLDSEIPRGPPQQGVSQRVGGRVWAEAGMFSPPGASLSDTSETFPADPGQPPYAWVRKKIKAEGGVVRWGRRFRGMVSTIKTVASCY